MIVPPALKPGDRVAFVAPARKVSPEEMAPAIEWVRSLGLDYVPGPNLYGADRQFSGTDAERLADLEWAFNAPDIQAIWAARGGYGTLRILDQLDCSGIFQYPKWVIGFSDLTCLHNKLGRLGIASVHGPMAISCNGATGDAPSFRNLQALLFGHGPLQYSVPTTHRNLAREGSGEGTLVGGNLSLLSQMVGTEGEYLPDGAILFLEDLDEYLYHVDRMMVHLKRAGWLAKLGGLVVGGLTDMKDNLIPFGKSAEEIVREAVEPWDFPISFGFPTGHQPANWPLIHGARVKLTVQTGMTTLQFL